MKYTLSEIICNRVQRTMLETKINKFLSEFDIKSLEGYSVYDAFNSTLLKHIGKLEFKLVNVI